MSARSVARRVRRWPRSVKVLAMLGPGLIAANAGNDAGGIATYASAGAQYAYRTLFVMVLVTIALIIVQEMSARLGVYTGEGLVSLIREQFARVGRLSPSWRCSSPTSGWSSPSSPGSVPRSSCSGCRVTSPCRSLRW